MKPNYNTDFPKLKASVYARISTEKQAEKFGYSAQLDKCKAIISLKDWELYEIYGKPKGVSGSIESKDREELSRLINDAKKGFFDAVVFYALDRLGRSTKIILNVIDQFKACNLKIISHKEHIDTSTASGELMLTFFAGIAQYEKRIILERMAAGKEIVKRRYGENGGLLPLGYKRGENSQVHIDSKEAAIVRNIFMARETGLSLRKIATWLNQLGVKTRKGKQWYASSVGVIINNKKKYDGEKRNGNENGICWPKLLLYKEDIEEEEDYLSEADFSPDTSEDSSE